MTTLQILDLRSNGRFEFPAGTVGATNGMKGVWMSADGSKVRKLFQPAESSTAEEKSTDSANEPNGDILWLLRRTNSHHCGRKKSTCNKRGRTVLPPLVAVQQVDKADSPRRAAPCPPQVRLNTPPKVHRSWALREQYLNY